MYSSMILRLFFTLSAGSKTSEFILETNEIEKPGPIIRRIIRLDINAVFWQILGQNSSLVDLCQRWRIIHWL